MPLPAQTGIDGLERARGASKSVKGLIDHICKLSVWPQGLLCLFLPEIHAAAGVIGLPSYLLPAALRGRRRTRRLLLSRRIAGPVLSASVHVALRCMSISCIMALFLDGPVMPALLVSLMVCRAVWLLSLPGLVDLIDMRLWSSSCFP